MAKFKRASTGRLPASLIIVTLSLLAPNNSLFRRVGNLASRAAEKLAFSTRELMFCTRILNYSL